MSITEDDEPNLIDFRYGKTDISYVYPTEPIPIAAESIPDLVQKMHEHGVSLRLHDQDYLQINYDLCDNQEWAQNQQATLMFSSVVYNEIGKYYDLVTFLKKLGLFSGVIGAYRYGFISIEEAIDCINYFRTNQKGTDPNDFVGQLKMRLDFLLSINYISQDEYNTVWSSQN
jgi:hypothetical protein